jgi:hypothetical protein
MKTLMGAAVTVQHTTKVLVDRGDNATFHAPSGETDSSKVGAARLVASRVANTASKVHFIMLE